MSPENRGVHPVLEQDHGYIFVDACMQFWPDADLPNAHHHGVTAFAATAWNPKATVADALQGIMWYHLVARQNPKLQIAANVKDIRQAKAEGRSAIILAAQDGDFIGNKLHRIEAFYRLGLRMMLPAYNASNLICDGGLDRTDSGLTLFGEYVVRECNRVGMVLDCSHIGRRASLDIMERSTQPVVFSHSNPRSVADVPRNIDDEQIKKCASTGGVVGTAAWGPLVMRKDNPVRPTVDEFVDCIDHTVQLLGNTDHVGIGTDMSVGTHPDDDPDPWGQPDYFSPVVQHIKECVPDAGRLPMVFPTGFSTYPEIMTVIDRLQRRGFTENDIRKVLGENFIRVFDQVWR